MARIEESSLSCFILDFMNLQIELRTVCVTLGKDLL